MEPSNPFFHRGPIRDPAYFFGRRRELDQALGLIRNGQSVSIVGPRRIGKTSLLLRLADEVSTAPERCCRVIVDCEGWGRASVGEVLARLWEELSVALVTADYAGLAAVPDPEPSYRAFERVVRGVTEQGIQIAFFMDEFESLCVNPSLDADLFSGLRALATRYGVSYVTVSPRPLLELPGAGDGALSSPFFNFFAQIRLQPFVIADAEQLLGDLSARGGHPFATEIMHLLIDLAGPHPFLLQIAPATSFVDEAGYTWRLDLLRQWIIGAHPPHTATNMYPTPRTF